MVVVPRGARVGVLKGLELIGNTNCNQNDFKEPNVVFHFDMFYLILLSTVTGRAVSVMIVCRGSVEYKCIPFKTCSFELLFFYYF